MTQFTAKKRGRFLEILRSTANVSEACRQATVSRQTVYKHRRDDILFAEQWEDAENWALDSAEGELHRRAVDGVDKPVFYKGSECGHVREYSDTCLIFLLKGKRRSVFGDKQELDVHTTKHTDPASISDDELARIVTQGESEPGS